MIERGVDKLIPQTKTSSNNLKNLFWCLILFMKKATNKEGFTNTYASGFFLLSGSKDNAKTMECLLSELAQLMSVSHYQMFLCKSNTT